MFRRSRCINYGRKIILRNLTFYQHWIKNYRWLHNLLRIHGIEFQSELIVYSKCRNAFYKGNERRRSSDSEPDFDDDDLKEYTEEEMNNHKKDFFR